MMATDANRTESNRLTPASLQRNRELAAIHAGKRALILDDDTYRAMLEHVTGHRSAAVMTGPERHRVLEHLRARGFRPQAGRRAGSVAGKLVAGLAMPAPAQTGGGSQEALILGLWDELRRIGALGFHARLDTWMDRQGVPLAHPRFCDVKQASRLIEALKSWLAREKRRRGLD